jgi:hypothetical protein
MIKLRGERPLPTRSRRISDEELPARITVTANGIDY